MRTRSILLVAAAFASSLALGACASSRSAQQQAGRAPDRLGDDEGPPRLETNAGQMEGVVAEVDRDAGTVSVQSGDTVTTVPLAAEATVHIDDFDASFEDVREGQQVRAALQDTGERVEAVRIQIMHQAVPVEGPDAEGSPEPAPDEGAPDGETDGDALDEQLDEAR
jgi:hypothetical protein